MTCLRLLHNITHSNPPPFFFNLKADPCHITNAYFLTLHLLKGRTLFVDFLLQANPVSAAVFFCFYNETLSLTSNCNQALFWWLINSALIVAGGRTEVPLRRLLKPLSYHREALEAVYRNFCKKTMLGFWDVFVLVRFGLKRGISTLVWPTCWKFECRHSKPWGTSNKQTIWQTRPSRLGNKLFQMKSNH